MNCEKPSGKSVKVAPPGSGHAGEMETSLYLHIAEEYVDMSQAKADVHYPENPIFYTANLAGEKREDATTAVTIREWWSTMSETGVKGDATLASKEKGEQFLEAAVTGLNNILDAFNNYPHRAIADKHTRERSLMTSTIHFARDNRTPSSPC